MMFKEISYVTIWFFVYAASTPSYAQTLHNNNPFCRSISSFNEHLQTYHEEKVWSGANNGTIYEVFSSIDGLTANKITQEGATWTADYTLSDGRKCLVATGVEWKDTFSPSWRVEKAPISKKEKALPAKDRKIWAITGCRITS